MESKFTNKIKILRATKEITQEELASKVGVTRQTIIAIEKNSYNPSLELSYKIAKTFNKKIEEVFIFNK